MRATIRLLSLRHSNRLAASASHSASASTVIQSTREFSSKRFRSSYKWRLLYLNNKSLAPPSFSTTSSIHQSPSPNLHAIRQVQEQDQRQRQQRPQAKHIATSPLPQKISSFSQAHLIPGKDSSQKETVLVLGSGWAGYIFSRKLSPKHHDCTVISPRSYFVFTPLLADTAAGNLDFSSIVEPMRDSSSRADFIQAVARRIDFAKKTVICEASIVKSGVTESPRVEENERRYDEGPETGSMRGKEHLRDWESGQTFEISYDKLVIAVGCVSQTFGTKGVRENAMFFKDVGDARRIKRRVRELFELAALPTTTEEMQRHLLHVAIVGAGPTGTELAATLRDFIDSNMLELYPAMRGKVRMTLYDVQPTVLSMFDKSLSQYAMETMSKDGIAIRTSHHIEELRWGTPNETDGPHKMDPKGCLTLKTKEEGYVGVGVCVWATGNTMNKFVKHSLDEIDKFPVESARIKDPGAQADIDSKGWRVKKAPNVGALLVDGHFRVQLEHESGQVAVLQDVFAIGDNAMPETGAPPATAQASSQEAKWLAKRFSQDDLDKAPGFSFHNMGSLAYIGSSNALMQIPHEKKKKHENKNGHDSNSRRNPYLPEGLTGKTAWLVWKVAYLSMSISWRNRCRILSRWIINGIFGSDISRF